MNNDTNTGFILRYSGAHQTYSQYLISFIIAQYLDNFILKVTSSVPQILAYLERVQENDYWDMPVQTWWVVLFSHGPFFAH